MKPEPFHPTPRGGTTKKLKFERDILEYQSSGNHLKEVPEVLSRLGHQAGSTETKVLAAKLHNKERGNPSALIGKATSFGIN